MSGKIETRPRCNKCNRLIRGELRERNYAHYQPYCSFHCQETARMNRNIASLAKAEASKNG